MALPLRSKKNLVACPYCFAEIDLAAVAFRCGGRPAAGRPRCVPHGDPIRSDQLGDGAAYLPPVLRTHNGYVVLDDDDAPELHLGKLTSSTKCNRCDGQTSQTICPACHSYLPAELSEGALSIAVVGARNSGKTVWLSALEQRLREHIPSAFSASVDHPGGTVGLADTLNRIRDDIESSNRLPNQTAASLGKQAPSVYRWSRIDGSGSRVLSVYDTAGEDVARRDQALLQQHLAASNAVVLVLDPFSFAGNRDLARERGATPEPDRVTVDVIDGLASALRTGQPGGRKPVSNRVDTPVAVVVTKMDAFWDHLDPQSPLMDISPAERFFDEGKSLRRHEALRELIQEWVGHPVLNKLDATFSTYRLFGVSALGREPDYQQSVVDSRPAPTHVEEPILWILAHQGFLPTSGG